MPTVITLTETATFEALRTVLLGMSLLSSTEGSQVPVVRGQVNRVPQPSLPDHVVMWPVRRERLSTDIDTYQDNIVTGSIAGNVLTVTALTAGSVVAAGQPVLGSGITPGCSIVSQTGGTPGGAGTYAVTPTASVESQQLYLGTVSLLQPVEVVIQLDIHGPLSADNAHIVSTILRDYTGVQAFADQGAGVSPLYTDDPRQSPFIDGEAQFEERWSVDVHLQVDPLVIVAQQFAATLEVTLVDVDAAYPVVDPTGLVDDGGVLVLAVTSGYPASSTGLAPGALWQNGRTIAVVPGHTPDPAAPPVFFGVVDAATLLALGGGDLPLVDPGVTGQIYNNGGVVCVA